MFVNPDEFTAPRWAPADNRSAAQRILDFEDSMRRAGACLVCARQLAWGSVCGKCGDAYIARRARYPELRRAVPAHPDALAARRGPGR